MKMLKNISIILVLSLIFIKANGQYKVPEYVQNYDSTKPTVYAVDLGGGYQQVADSAAKADLSSDKRVVGMMVSYKKDGLWRTERYDGINTLTVNWINESNWTKLMEGDSIIAENDSIYVLSPLSIDSEIIAKDTARFNTPIYVNGSLYDGTTNLTLGTANQIPFMNTAGTDFDYSSNFKWNDTSLTIYSGSSNTYIGYNTGVNASVTKTGNTFVGYQAGQAGGDDANVFVGFQSGVSNTAKDNVMLGWRAGQINVSGANNVFLGKESGANNTGSANVFLGRQAGQNETGSNKLYIENSNSTTPLIYGEFDNDLIQINGDFKVQDDTLEVTADTTYIRNKLKVTGGAIYLDGRTITPATASAYIETGDEVATTISAAGTYYFLKGTFTNKDAYNFDFTGDTLQYVGTDSIHVTLQYVCTFGVGQVNTLVTTAVSIDDVVAPQSVMERSIAATDDRGSWAGLATLTLGPNDKIKLIVKADKTGTVTAYRFSTIIKN